MLVAHNGITFDIPAIQKLYPDFKPTGVIRDTLVLSRLIRSDLKNDDFTQGHKYPKMPKKLYGSHSLGRGVIVLDMRTGQSTDWSEYSEEMMRYCLQDTLVTHRL